MTATTCGLCGHSPACGSAEGLDEHDQRVPLCHADDHSCYHRWTVYKERPAPLTPTNEPADGRLTEQEKAANRRRWWGLTDPANEPAALTDDRAAIECPQRCEIPPSVTLTLVPVPRHAWGDVIVCPNEGCGRAFLVNR